MKSLALLSFLILCLTPLLQAQQTHVILCGGPALLKKEGYRAPVDRHDRFWGNFIRASTIRIDEIRKAYGANARVTWIVYKPGYVTRGREDGNPLITWINGQASKRQVKLVWVNSANQAINAINAHPTRSIISFDFFGHSNKHCFLLDYSNHILGASNAWIHENDLGKINASSFAQNAACQSYGCYTGESMSAFWKRSVGTTLVGAQGKTDYRSISKAHLPSVTGRWIR